MKDLHWFFVFAAIFITPLLPAILRSKCPGCGKRKLQSLETIKVLTDGGNTQYTYITVYKCDHCHAVFKRNKSGALEQSSQEEHAILKQAAVVEDAH